MSGIDALVDLPFERSVLGQLIGFSLWPAFEAAGLTEEHFFREEHRVLLIAAKAVHEAGGVADIVTVAQQLRQTGSLERVGPAYLAGLLEGAPRPQELGLPLIVARLEELAAGRLVYYAAQRVQAQLETPGAVADGALTEHFDTVQSVLERQQGPGAAWLDVEAQLQARARDVAEARAGKRVYFGLPGLDAIVDGIRPGEVCGILARPGIGKTILLCAIARAVTEFAGHVFVSLEMPASQIVGRLQQMLYGLGRHQLEDRAQAHVLDDDAYRAAFRSLVVVDTPSLSVGEISRRVRQISRGPLAGQALALVTVDHLGLVGGDRALSTYDRISVQAREIKELAKRLHCAVLLAVQVNREAGGDGSRELGLGSARDSGVVEEAMDYLIGLRRLDRSVTLTPMERQRYQDVIFAKVIKNRHGDPGATELAYRFSPIGLKLTEDPYLRPESDDIARIAANRAGTGGRR